jgi:hypothetical protein
MEWWAFLALPNQATFSLHPRLLTRLGGVQVGAGLGQLLCAQE